MARQRNRFGSVRKLPSGKWQARWKVDGRDQGRTFPTKTEAQQHLVRTEAEQLRGEFVDQRAGRETFGAYAAAWLASRGDLRPTTLAKYQGLLRLHLLPAFRSVPLVALRPAQVGAWHAKLAAEHPSTAAGAYRLLAVIYNTAVRDEVVGKSPCRIVGAATECAPERPTATVAELQAAITKTPERLRAAFLLAAWCQLRRGEVLALQRRDIDLEAGTVRVERAYVVTQDGVPIIGPPKTAKGRRTVHMPPVALEAVRSHLARFVGSEREAWVFAGRGGGAPIYHRTLTRAWAQAREAAGRADLHVHDLRHTGLTWVAQAGATTAELMHRGGHASPVAAIRYQHAAAERDRALAEKLGQMA